MAPLLLVGAIAWAQIDQALTARDGHEMFRFNHCAGTVYGGDDYTADERAEYEDLCGHPPRTDIK